MKMRKWVVMWMMVMIAMVCVKPVEVSAGSDCAYGSCVRTVVSGGRYCSIHTCGESGCEDSRYGKSHFCNKHTCKHSGCTFKKSGSRDFCLNHTCGGGKNGCGREVDKANEKCSYHKEKDAEQTSTTKPSVSTGSSSSILDKKIVRKKKTSTITTGVNSTSKKKYTMPDCDDYDSYSDFMDDWDGNMPDGSDAEDYWYNW